MGVEFPTFYRCPVLLIFEKLMRRPALNQTRPKWTFRTRRVLKSGSRGRILKPRSSAYEHHSSGRAKSVRTAVGCQIFAAACGASSASAREPSSTACRTCQIQNANPPGSIGLEAYTGAVRFSPKPFVSLSGLAPGLFTRTHRSPELRTRLEAKTPGRGLRAVRSVPRSRGRVLLSPA